MKKLKIKSANVRIDGSKYPSLFVDIRFDDTPESYYPITLSLNTKYPDVQFGFSKGVTVLFGLMKLLEVETLEEFVGKELYISERGDVFTSLDMQRIVDTTAIWNNEEIN